MFATLRHFLRRLFGRDQEAPSQPEQKRLAWGHEERGHGQAEGPEDKPATDWTERYTRNNSSSGDNPRERLRSLPDEQKAQRPQNKGRGHTL